LARLRIERGESLGDPEISFNLLYVAYRHDAMSFFSFFMLEPHCHWMFERADISTRCILRAGNSCRFKFFEMPLSIQLFIKI